MPEPIEHWIEPEDRRSKRRKLSEKFGLLFRRERGDDLLKARIAAERVPKWHQFQLAIGEVARAADSYGKLFAGEILVTNPRSGHRQIFDHVRAMGRIFFHGQKLDRVPALAKRFLFTAKASVDQAEDAQRWAVIWLGLDDFLLFRAGSSESRSRFGIVFGHTSNDGFYALTPTKH